MLCYYNMTLEHRKAFLPMRALICVNTEHSSGCFHHCAIMLDTGLSVVSPSLLCYFNETNEHIRPCCRGELYANQFDVRTP